MFVLSLGEGGGARTVHIPKTSVNTFVYRFYEFKNKDRRLKIALRKALHHQLKKKTLTNSKTFVPPLPDGRCLISSMKGFHELYSCYDMIISYGFFFCHYFIMRSGMSGPGPVVNNKKFGKLRVSRSIGGGREKQTIKK